MQYLDLPCNIAGRESNIAGFVVGCRTCRNPDDTHDLPEHIPADLITRVL